MTTTRALRSKMHSLLENEINGGGWDADAAASLVVSTSDIRQDHSCCVNPEGASVISVVGVVGPISPEVPKFLTSALPNLGFSLRLPQILCDNIETGTREYKQRANPRSPIAICHETSQSFAIKSKSGFEYFQADLEQPLKAVLIFLRLLLGLLDLSFYAYHSTQEAGDFLFPHLGTSTLKWVVTASRGNARVYLILPLGFLTIIIVTAIKYFVEASNVFRRSRGFYLSIDDDFRCDRRTRFARCCSLSLSLSIW